ncbi:MAG: nucleotidyltransferase family protein [Rubrivivax sp.]|nr:nucleotidyltransferase family protein [Rubrivivax sp.]
MQALILAGGFGTRLAATVPGVPKPMAPVCGRPFLELLLNALHGKGVRRAVLSLGYRAETIVQHFGDRYRGMALLHEVETTPLGTGGAIRQGLARCTAEAVLVVNGDTLLDLELDAVAALWAAHREPIIAACHVDDSARYGRLSVQDGRLTGFAEKGGGGPGWINSGHYLLPRNLFDGADLPPTFSFEGDFLAPRLPALAVRVFESRGDFIDIGVPQDYALAQTQLVRWAGAA